MRGGGGVRPKYRSCFPVNVTLAAKLHGLLGFEDILLHVDREIRPNVDINHA